MEMNDEQCSSRYSHQLKKQSVNVSEDFQKDFIDASRARKVHVNPNFNNGKSLIIHVNPRIHQNRKIHVNPKIMKDIVPVDEKPTIPRVSLNYNEISAEDKLLPPEKQMKKSIYVNPRLMKKLTSTGRENIDFNVSGANHISTNFDKSNSSIPCKTNEIIIADDKTCNKVATNRLLSLSRRKLVRINPNSRKATSLQSPNVAKRLNAKSLIEKSASTFDSRKFNSMIDKHKISAYKIDRTAVERRKRKKINIPEVRNGYVNKGLIAIGGVMYQSSRTQLVRSAMNSTINRKKNNAAVTKGDTFFMAKNGKKLHRLYTGREESNGTRYVITRNSISRRTVVKKVPNSIVQTSHKNVISYKAKQRSLQILRDKLRKNYIPCLLYRRFGYCASHVKGTCPKLHDKKQVALCKNFLQGKCLLDDCPLSHDIGPEKMPTCKYFLEGCCIRDNCPYLHVKVSSNTPICGQFLRGYCADGNKCKQRHTYVCPEYEKSGNCAKGKYCPFPHKIKASSALTAKCKMRKTIRKISPCKKNSNNLSSNVAKTEEDNRKRYYDKASPTDAQLAEMRENIVKKMKFMKACVGIAENNDETIDKVTTIVDDNKEIDFDNERPKRLPIGPLPAYIPIN